jgi:hypothetical protein
MEREAIERLAIDLSAGELNEDAQALFNEYLAGHPEANKWLLDMQETINQTQAAFNAKTASTKPTAIKPPLQLKWLTFIRWAAVIAIAVCIGAAAGRWSKPAVPQQKPPQVTASIDSPAKRQGFNLDDLGEGIWRDKVTAMLNPPPQKIHKDYVPGPSMWEKYRQYIKERHYE